MSQHPSTHFPPTMDTSDGRHTVYDVPVLVNPHEPEKPLVDVLNAMERHISCSRFQLFVLQVERAWPDNIDSLKLGWESEMGEMVMTVHTTHTNPAVQQSHESIEFGSTIDLSAFSDDKGFLGLVNLLFEQAALPIHKNDLPAILNRSMEPAVLAKIFVDHLEDNLPDTPPSPKPRF